MSVDEWSEPRFSIHRRDVAVATNFRFLKFNFHAVTPKWCDVAYDPGKRKYRKFCFLSNGTIRNDISWPRLPKLLLVCTSPSSPICSKSTRPIFAVFSPAGSHTGVDLCCEIMLRFLKGRCQREQNFCHFRTFSARSGRYFVMLRLHSFDLLYSCRIVADLLGICCTACRGVVVGIWLVADLLWSR